jgi:tetratricopeptide (TPR) repeat protein
MQRGNKTQGASEIPDQRVGYYETLRAYYPLILFFGMLLLLSFLHIYPQAAYPLRGLSIISGMLIIAAVLLYLGYRGSRIGKQGVISLWLYGIFLLWCLVRNRYSPVPAMGKPFLALALEGFWVLAAVQIVLSMERAPGAAQDRPFGVSSPGQRQFSLDDLSLRSLVFLYFTLLSLLFCLYGIYQYFIGYDRQLEAVFDIYKGQDQLSRSIVHALKERRVSARFGNPNLLAAFLSMSLPFLLYIFLKFKSRAPGKGAGAKLFFFGIGLIVIFVLILTQSRGGLLSFIFGGSVFLVFYLIYPGQNKLNPAVNGKKLLKKIIIALMGLFALAFIFLLIQNATRTPDMRGGSYLERLFRTGTIRERMYYIRTGWRIIRQNPVFGAGPAGYELYYPRFRCFGARETKYAHNVIIQMGAELGVAGLAFFAALVVYHIRIAMRLLKDKPEIIVFLAAALIFLFNSLFEYGFYHDSLYLNFCLCLGVMAGVYPPEEKGKKGRRAPELTGPTQYYLPFALPLAVSFLFFPGIVIKPFYAASQVQFGDDIVTEGNHEEAFKYYQKCVRFEPDNPWYHQRLGQSYLALGDTFRAEEHLKEAIKLNPFSALFRDEIAHLYNATWRLEDAIENERAATAAYPLKGEYHYKLAKLLKKSGNIREAREAAMEAVRVELDPTLRNTYQTLLKELPSP